MQKSSPMPFPNQQMQSYQPTIPMYPMYLMPQSLIPKQPQKRRKLNGIGDKNGGEKLRVFTRLKGFKAKDSMAWSEITRRYGSELKHGELLSIAEVVASNANVQLDRDAKRRKSVLIKWFEENWTRISPFLNYVVLEDKKTQNPGICQYQNIPDNGIPSLYNSSNATISCIQPISPNLSAVQSIQNIPSFQNIQSVPAIVDVANTQRISNVQNIGQLGKIQSTQQIQNSYSIPLNSNNSFQSNSMNPVNNFSFQPMIQGPPILSSMPSTGSFQTRPEKEKK